jgi:hypothetical protein
MIDNYNLMNLINAFCKTLYLFLLLKICTGSSDFKSLDHKFDEPNIFTTFDYG